MQTAFSLLETMRLENGRVARLDRHLARMASSAAHFGYPCDHTRVRAAVEEARAAHAQGCWRLRLLLDAGGTATTTCTPHANDTRVWRVGLARSPIDSRDGMLRHKTTSRSIYDTSRHEQPHLDDVLLWNEREEITESTIANVVFEVNGERVTPPVACGLLPGIYRGELLDGGVLREQVLTKDDLPRVSRAWLINSLRGWIDVTLAT